MDFLGLQKKAKKSLFFIIFDGGHFFGPPRLFGTALASGLLQRQGLSAESPQPTGWQDRCPRVPVEPTAVDVGAVRRREE
jgi:hypothetical protein